MDESGCWTTERQTLAFCNFVPYVVPSDCSEKTNSLFCCAVVAGLYVTLDCNVSNAVDCIVCVLCSNAKFLFFFCGTPDSNSGVRKFWTPDSDP